MNLHAQGHGLSESIQTGRRKPLDIYILASGLESLAHGTSSTVDRQPGGSRDQEAKEAALQSSSDSVRSLLKLEYLRQMSPQQAFDYIHVHDKKKKRLNPSLIAQGGWRRAKEITILRLY